MTENKKVQYGVNLTPGQIQEIAKAAKNNFNINISLKASQLNAGEGSYPIIIAKKDFARTRSWQRS